MSGGSKGRSVKALREKVDRLAARPETSDEANRLRSYLKKVLLAQQLRPDRVVKLPASDVEAIIRELAEEGVVFTAEIQAGLVEHRVNTLLAQGDLLGLVEATKPWGAEKPFDPLKPSLAPIEGMPLGDKVAKFRLHFWQKSITPLLMSGQEGEARVLKACEIVLNNFSAEEAIDLDAAAASVLQESITCARALRATITASTDPDDEEYVAYIHARKSRTDRSIGTSVSNAVHSNQNLQSQVEQLIRGGPVIKEYGGKVKKHTAALHEEPPAEVREHFMMLRAMCEDMSRIRSSSSSALFDKFGDLLLSKLREAWNKVKDGMKTSSDYLTGMAFEALQSCISEATTAFSLEQCVVDMQLEAAQWQRLQSGAARTEVLMKSLKPWTKGFDIKSKEFPAQVASLESALSGCLGLPITGADLVQHLDEVSEILTKNLPAHLASPEFGDIVKQVLNCADLMLQLNLQGWGECLRLWLTGAKSVLELGMRIKDALNVRTDSGMLSIPEEKMNGVNCAVVAAVEQRGICGKGKPPPAIANLLKALDDAIGDGRSITEQFGKAMLADGLEKVAETVKVCEGFAGGLHTQKRRWYQEVAGVDAEAWAQLRKLGEEALKKIDTKKLEVQLKESHAIIEKVTKSEAFLGDLYNKNCTKDATDKLREIAIEMHVCMLFWHLNNEQDHGTLRARVQEQVRLLRGHGVKEKALLPECMYKRSWDALLPSSR